MERRLGRCLGNSIVSLCTGLASPRESHNLHADLGWWPCTRYLLKESVFSVVIWILLIWSSVRPSVRSRSLVNWLVGGFFRSFFRSFARAFVRSFVRSFAPSHFRSLARSFFLLFHLWIVVCLGCFVLSPVFFSSLLLIFLYSICSLVFVRSSVCPFFLLSVHSLIVSFFC